MENTGHRLNQEQLSDSQSSGLTGVKALSRHKARTEELVQVSPVFRLLSKDSEVQGTASQWREFTKDLASRLEEETKEVRRFPRLETLRDRFTATDSVLIRITGYLMILVILGAIGAVLWFAVALMLSETSPVMVRTGSLAPQRSVSTAQVVASTACDKPVAV